MMIAHVRGQFNKISGTIYYDPLNINASSVELVIDVSKHLYRDTETRRSPEKF